MAITIIKLGSSRKANERLRIGAVRRPPRGVPKSEYSKRDFYNVWLPTLALSQRFLKEAKTAHDKKSWATFERKFRSEMKAPNAGKILDLLAALSHRTDFFGGMLLQRREAMPPIDLAPVVCRTRRRACRALAPPCLHWGAPSAERNVQCLL